MTGVQFQRWVVEMKAAKLARSAGECAKLLGVSANAVVEFKKRGCDTRTALACRALLHRMTPYS